MAFDIFVGSCGEWKAHGGMRLYFVCDFNGRWLKDLNFFVVSILLTSVEGRSVGDCTNKFVLFKMVVMHCF
jgi:hypothetical protein